MMDKERFQRAFFSTMGIEGEYSNDPRDSGGETYCGISKRHHPEMWKDGRPKDCEIEGFYYNNFWKPLGCEKFPFLIGFELFDTAINCGGGRASRFLQKAYNLVRKEKWKKLQIDGKIGPLSKRAIKRMYKLNASALVKAMNGYQFMHYEKQNDHHHIRGWIANRVDFYGE